MFCISALFQVNMVVGAIICFDYIITICELIYNCKKLIIKLLWLRCAKG